MRATLACFGQMPRGNAISNAIWSGIKMPCTTSPQGVVDDTQPWLAAMPRISQRLLEEKKRIDWFAAVKDTLPNPGEFDIQNEAMEAKAQHVQAAAGSLPGPRKDAGAGSGPAVVFAQAGLGHGHGRSNTEVRHWRQFQGRSGEGGIA